MTSFFLLLAFLSVTVVAQQNNPAYPTTPMPTMAGKSTRIVVSSPDLIQSMAWWVKIGFQPQRRPTDRPDSAITLFDGQIELTLVSTKQPSPVLMFASDNMKVLNDTLKALAIPVNADLEGPSYKELRFQSPSGILIAARPSDVEFGMIPTSYSNSVIGNLTELSIGTTAITGEINFWQSLGFVMKRTATTPYTFAIFTDGHFNIGLHDDRDIPNLTLTYFAKDMAERIGQVTKSGIKIEDQPAEGAVPSALIISPEGTRIYMFEGEQ